YPGSIERTSLAEIGEPKGFLLLGATPGEPLTWTFRPLPARPMYRRELGTEGLSAAELEAAIGAIVGSVEPDAVLSIQLTSPLDESQRRLMTAANLRALAPATMNLEVRPAGGFRRPPAD
ncbi:MAG: hypothetical protein JNJ80_11390, partial [Gemmatimonadetes bacterium]|nr:hypothetical protein [Gemmatimonadota bacterium]